MSQEGCSTIFTSKVACYNNRYYLNVRINLDALALLPQDWNLTGLHSVTLDSTIEDPEPLSAQDEDRYNGHLSGSFVPSTTQRMTEQETIRHAVCAKATASSASTQAHPNDALSISLVRKNTVRVSWYDHHSMHSLQTMQEQVPHIITSA